MNRRSRWLLGILSAGLALLGGFSLHYTKPSGLEHHRESAERLGLPKPDDTVQLAGGLMIAIGAGATGYALGARSR